MPQEQTFENKLSIAKVNRKIAKPIMEKKRRARINASLNELKNLLVEVLQKEGCRHSNKMEKADILEMAVRHLKNLQRQQGNITYQNSPLHSSHDAFPAPTEVPNVPTNSLPNHFPVAHLTNDKLSPTSSQNTTNNVVIPQPIKLDYNKLIQPNITAVAPQGNRTLSSVGQPVMTRTTNGELAVVLPQNFMNQRQCNGNYVLPLFSLPQTLEQSYAQMSDLKLSPSSEQSSAPVSPVWRPW